MHARMLLPVQHHRRTLSEALPANVTDVGSLAHVSQQMDLLRAETAEGLAANGAEIRLLARVRSQMFRQAVLELKLHTALLADVLHLVQLSVALQILLSLKALPAHLTLELLNFCLVLVMLVEVQRALAGVRCATYIANARFGIVILHVCRIVGLHFEHFAALLATVVIILGVFANVMYLQIRLRARLEIAQSARVQLRGFVMDFHVPREVRTGFETFRANRALVRS